MKQFTLLWIMLAGPSLVFAQSEPWRPLGPFGGDVADVNVSPTKPNVMLAGVAPPIAWGRLFRSTNAGASWSQVTSFGNRSANDIEFGADGTVWVAGTELVSKSEDDGLTFTKCDMGIGWKQAYAVEIDPTNPQVLWAGLEQGLVMKSHNGGTTWENVTPWGVQDFPCKDIALNPTDPMQVMAVFSGGFSDMGGGAVFFTADGGQTWNNVSAGLPPNPVLAVRYDRGRWFVAGGAVLSAQHLGLWRSTTDGQEWTRLDQGWPNAIAGGVAIDPNDPDVILAATVDGVHKSEDGGQTWTISSGGSSGFSLASVRFAPGSSQRVLMGAASFGAIVSEDAAATTRMSSLGIYGLDVFSVAANPSNPAELAAAFQGQNNGGVYVSTNGGLAWKAQQLPGTRYSYVKFDRNGTLYALSDGPSTIAKEGVYRRNANGTWTPLGPDVGSHFETKLLSIDFGHADPNLFIASGNDSGAEGREATIWRSTDAGAQWKKVLETTPLGQIAAAERVMIIPDGTDKVALAAVETSAGEPMKGVYRSVDSGETWSKVSGTGLPQTLCGYDLTTSHGNPHLVYVADEAYDGGGIYRSHDAGATWSTYLTGYYVRGVAVDPSSEDDVYFCCYYGETQVYHATQNGKHVASAHAGVDGWARQIIAVPGASPRLLLATSMGVYELPLRAEPPVLHIDRVGNKAVLSWTNAAFALQCAPAVTGAFTNIPAASSPYTNPISGGSQFFRLRK